MSVIAVLAVALVACVAWDMTDRAVAVEDTERVERRLKTGARKVSEGQVGKGIVL